MGRDQRRNPFNGWKKSQEITPRQVYDRFGREVQLHDIVQIPGHPGTLWRVVEIVPDMSPQAPGPNIQKVTVTAVESFGVPGGAPILDLIKVRDREEYMAAAAAPEQAQAQGLDDGPQGDPQGAPAVDDTPAAESSFVGGAALSGPRLVTEN